MSEAELTQELEETQHDEGQTAQGLSTVLPLNSRRLTNTHLRRITHAMELPVSIPRDQLRQMVDGKLIAMEKEPKIVQVLIAEEGSGKESLALQDVGRVFVASSILGATVSSELETGSGGLGSEAEEDEERTLEELREELEQVMEEIDV